MSKLLKGIKVIPEKEFGRMDEDLLEMPEFYVLGKGDRTFVYVDMYDDFAVFELEYTLCDIIESIRHPRVYDWIDNYALMRIIKDTTMDELKTFITDEDMRTKITKVISEMGKENLTYRMLNGSEVSTKMCWVNWQHNIENMNNIAGDLPIFESWIIKLITDGDFDQIKQHVSDAYEKLGIEEPNYDIKEINATDREKLILKIVDIHNIFTTTLIETHRINAMRCALTVPTIIFPEDFQREENSDEEVLGNVDDVYGGD